MLQISQYDFSDNPNLPRIIDSAKRDYGVDLELDFVIEQVGDCLRLIGKRAKRLVEETITTTNGVIKLNCNVDNVESLKVCDNVIPFTQNFDKLTVGQQYINTPIVITYTDYREDKNGFPYVSTDQEYYACLHWVIYKLLLRRFMMGTEQGNRLQYFERLKDKYINQARVTITNGDMQQIVDTMYSTYGRINTKYRK